MFRVVSRCRSTMGVPKVLRWALAPTRGATTMPRHSKPVHSSGTPCRCQAVCNHLRLTRFLCRHGFYIEDSQQVTTKVLLLEAIPMLAKGVVLLLTHLLFPAQQLLQAVALLGRGSN